METSKRTVGTNGNASCRYGAYVWEDGTRGNIQNDPCPLHTIDVAERLVDGETDLVIIEFLNKRPNPVRYAVKVQKP